jgi:transposase-like protein
MRKNNLTEEEQKLAVLEILQGRKTAGQVAKERGISDSLVYKWRDKALTAVQEAFSEKNRRGKKDDAASERERLLKIIGEQACVIDTLKKTSVMLSR